MASITAALNRTNACPNTSDRDAPPAIQSIIIRQHSKMAGKLGREPKDLKRDLGISIPLGMCTLPHNGIHPPGPPIDRSTQLPNNPR